MKVTVASAFYNDISTKQTKIILDKSHTTKDQLTRHISKQSHNSKKIQKKKSICPAYFTQSNQVRLGNATITHSRPTHGAKE